MQIEAVGEDLASVTLVRDGDSKRTRGPFIGLYGVPPRGGYVWYANNGDWGEAENEHEAQREIWKAWQRETGNEFVKVSILGLEGDEP